MDVMPGFSRRSRTEKIILHHTASATDLTLADLDSMHKARGYKGVGYNLYIRQTGTLYIGRGEDAVGAHAGAKSGFNSKSVGVSLSGNFDVGANSINAAQWSTLIPLLARLCKKYNLTPEDIIGHRDVTPTACPGKNTDLCLIRDAVRQMFVAPQQSPFPPLGSHQLTDAQKEAGITALRILYGLPLPQPAVALLNDFRPYVN